MGMGIIGPLLLELLAREPPDAWLGLDEMAA